MSATSLNVRESFPPAGQAIEVGNVGGRLAGFHQEWQKITKDKFVLDCIKGCKIGFDQTPVQANLPNHELQADVYLRIEDAFGKLIAKGAVEKCESTDTQFISTYFLAKKSADSDRFILNLKKLNAFIQTDHFELEDLKTAIKIVSNGSYMTSIDLQDA